MPYITLAEFKAVSEPILKACGDSADSFDVAESQAAQLVYSYVGGTIPASAADAPQKLKLPAIWITQRILIANNSSLSAEKIAMVNDSYNQAITLLERYQSRTPGKALTLGEVTPKYEF